jgi:non-specific serine/threonine protein kinase
MAEQIAPEELQARRRALGLTQAAPAARLDVAANTVARWERGEAGIRDAQRVQHLLDELRGSMQSAGRPPEPRPRHNLPRQLTSFIGREAELTDLQRLLTSSHLLTLVGVGGIGKTRLALEVAAAAEHQPNGAALAELTPVADPALVPQAVATALDMLLPADVPAISALVAALADRPLLLVLDNCEHVVDAAAALSDRLLRACAGMRILATSRQPLGVPGEIVWQVGSLPFPDVGPAPAADQALSYAAVRLFVERATAAAPGFMFNDDTMSIVARICHRLEGIPLAIELAASRVRLLGVEQIDERLDDRFRLLTGGGRTAPQRQQTLRAAFDWSYALLSEPERVVLRRLSVFVGGFAAEAAEAVCGSAAHDGPTAAAVFEAVSGLVDKSLVQVEGDQRRTRYRLLETVREYAAEQLAAAGEAAAIANRHRDWCLSLTERALPQLTGRDQVAWYRRLAVELDNCRAARTWMRANPDGGALELRLAAALGRYWHVCASGGEGRDWLTQALARGPDAPSTARARALTWSGQLECLHGDAEVGRSRLAQAVSVARQMDDDSLLCLTLRHLALYGQDQTAVPMLLEEAASVARAVGDTRELALALSYLGAVHEQRGRADRAEALYAEALASARASGDAIALTDALDRLGSLAARRGDYDEAVPLLTEALSLSEAIGYGMYTSLVHRRLAQIALGQGKLGEARTQARASLALARVLARHALGLWPLQLAATLATRSGQCERAVRIIAAAMVWRERYELHDQSLWMRALPENEADDLLRVARAAIGDAAVAVAWAEGSALSLEAALDQALAEDDRVVSADRVPMQGAATSTGQSAPPSPDGITRREREVAALVGRGLSNRQIAERLVITEGTAKVHVGRVLAKLGFHSRAQLAAWAVQQGALEPVAVSHLSSS